MISALVVVVFSGLLWLRFRVVRKWKYCPNLHKLDGKSVLITGGTEGIGKAVAVELAKRNATIYITGRYINKTAASAIEITRLSGNSKVYGRCLDLSSFKSIRSFAESLKNNVDKLDILIENAAYLGAAKTSTDEGLEMTFTVNHLGHFLLFHELLSILVPRHSGHVSSKLIVVASDAHKLAADMFLLDDLSWLTSPQTDDYSPYLAYSRSKMANILFTFGVNCRFAEKGITAFAVHPGATNTNLFNSWSDSRFKRFLLRGIASLFFRSPELAAQTIVYCVTDSGLPKSQSAELYVDCKRTVPSLPTNYRDVSDQLWEISSRLTGTRLNISNCMDEIDEI